MRTVSLLPIILFVALACGEASVPEASAAQEETISVETKLRQIAQHWYSVGEVWNWRYSHRTTPAGFQYLGVDRGRYHYIVSPHPQNANRVLLVKVASDREGSWLQVGELPCKGDAIWFLYSVSPSDVFEPETAERIPIEEIDIPAKERELCRKYNDKVLASQ